MLAFAQEDETVMRKFLTNYRLFAIAPIAIAAALPAFSLAAEKTKGEEAAKVTFEDHVLPIFRARCGTCHNGSDRRGGLVLDDYATMLEGGASGDVVFGGDLDSSYLWSLITHDSEPVMPPNASKMPDDELALVKAWIEQGILKDSGSKAKKSAPNPALAKVTVSMDRPEGPPPMPAKYLGDPATVPARPNSVTGLAVNPWSSVAAIAGFQQITLVDLNLMAPLGTLAFPEGTPQRIGFSQNGQLLFAGGGRGGQLGRVVVFDLVSGDRIAEVANEYDSVIAADLSPDLSLVVTGTPKKLVRVYQTGTNEKLYEADKHTDWVTATAFSPDGVLLATADRAGGLVIWEAETGREFYVLAGHKSAINSLAWRSDSNVLATVGDDDEVHLWEMNEGKEVKKFNGGVGDIVDIDYTRDGKILVTGRTDRAKLFDAAGKMLREFQGLSDDGMRVAYDHEGGRVLAGDWLGNVLVWSASDGKKLGTLRTNERGANQQLTVLGQSIEQQQQQKTRLAGELATLNKALAERKQKAAAAKKSLDQAVAADAAVRKDAAQRDDVLNKAKAALAAAQAALKAATTTQVTAKQAVDSVSAARKQLETSRDEAKKAVELSSKDDVLKASAGTALAAAEKSVTDANSQLSANQKLLESATADLKAKKDLADKAGVDLNNAVANRKQLDEKLVAAQKQLAAWKATYAKASSMEQPSEAEKKRVTELSAQVAKLDQQLKPLVDRRSQLQKILAMGNPSAN